MCTQIPPLLLTSAGTAPAQAGTIFCPGYCSSSILTGLSDTTPAPSSSVLHPAGRGILLKPKADLLCYPHPARAPCHTRGKLLSRHHRVLRAEWSISLSSVRPPSSPPFSPSLCSICPGCLAIPLTHPAHSSPTTFAPVSFLLRCPLASFLVSFGSLLQSHHRGLPYQPMWSGPSPTPSSPHTQLYFFFFFKDYFIVFVCLPHDLWILVPRPGIEPSHSAVKAQSPKQWATRGFPTLLYFLLNTYCHLPYCIYWVWSKSLGFSVWCNRKTQMNFLTSPIVCSLQNVKCHIFFIAIFPAPRIMPSTQQVLDKYLWDQWTHALSRRRCSLIFKWCLW